MQANSPERLYSIEETRRFLGIGPTTMFSLIRGGQITARKIGARTLIPESEIQRFTTALPAAGRPQSFAGGGLK